MSSTITMGSECKIEGLRAQQNARIEQIEVAIRTQGLTNEIRNDMRNFSIETGRWPFRQSKDDIIGADRTIIQVRELPREDIDFYEDEDRRATAQTGGYDLELK